MEDNMKRKHNLAIASILLASLTLGAGLTSCNTNGGDDEDGTQTVICTMDGAGTINEVDYNFEIRILEEDQEFYIKTLNTEIEEIWGEWTYTTGKGYILTFDDAYWTEKKVKYDEETNEFYLTYEVNLGSAYGKTKVKFKGDAGSFKDEYDHEGWGFEPFEFGVTGADVFGMTTIDITLTCYEDLTFKTVASCPLIAVPQRTGTYVFDANEPSYTFTFSDADETAKTTYEDGTYSVTINLDVTGGMFKMPFTITYTPE